MQRGGRPSRRRCLEQQRTWWSYYARWGVGEGYCLTTVHRRRGEGRLGRKLHPIKP